MTGLPTSVSDEKKAQLLANCLRGPAGEWYQSLPPECKSSYNRLEPKLWERFTSDTDVTTWAKSAFDAHVQTLSIDTFRNHQDWEGWLSKAQTLASAVPPEHISSPILAEEIYKQAPLYIKQLLGRPEVVSVDDFVNKSRSIPLETYRDTYKAAIASQPQAGGELQRPSSPLGPRLPKPHKPLQNPPPDPPLQDGQPPESGQGPQSTGGSQGSGPSST